MNLWTAISFAASITSVVLAVVAIAITFALYKFSNDASKDIQETSNRIDKVVSRLEDLFENYTATPLE